MSLFPSLNTQGPLNELTLEGCDFPYKWILHCALWGRKSAETLKGLLQMLTPAYC